MTMAMTKLIGPVKPSSMDSVAPRRPEMMPSGRPKLRPQPDWIMGTIARTMTPFIPKRTNVSLIDASRRTWTKGAMIKSRTRKAAIRMRGHPASSMNFLSLFMR